MSLREDLLERARLEESARDPDWLRAFNAARREQGLAPFIPWQGDCRLFSGGHCLVEWHDPCPFGVPKQRGLPLRAFVRLLLLVVIGLAIAVAWRLA